MTASHQEESGQPDRDRPSATPIAEWLRTAGEVGRDLLAVNWESTPLGPPGDWPGALATTVRTLLSSRFSMWMAWGPELTFFCNSAYRRDTLGKKYPWALGRSAREVWAEIWPDIGPRIESVLTTGQATWDESLLLFLERSGYVEETYHTFSYSPLTDDAGRIAGMLCVVTEDTERVIAERRIALLRDLGSEPATGHDERAYLKAAARNLSANDLPFTLMYLFDEDQLTAELAASSGIAAGHAAAPVTIPVPAGEPWPISRSPERNGVVVEDIDRTWDGLPTGAWQEPPTTAVLLPLINPADRKHPFGVLVMGANRYRPLDDAYRSFLGLLAAQLASGISSARAYAAERRRAEELAELDRAKTAFFTNVSHELRTPLTLLLGPAEDALSDPASSLTETDRHRMQIIARNGQRLLQLVNTLLDFSRLESGAAAASFEPVDIAHYTAELASMFEPAVERAGLALRVECSALSEPAFVDREMWAKIMLNLLSNALKFTFRGAITVRIEEANGWARLSVIDSGVGIDLAEQAKLFERFHRVTDARARTYEGSGIGLALVAELTEVHGGRVAVHSVRDGGSTFTVEIPLGDAHLPAEQIASEPRQISVQRTAAGFLAEVSRWNAAADGPEPDSANERDERPRILVVDDNADMREYVSELLSEEYSVLGAADGLQALELAQADPPDLVLTDVMMPRLDGFGLLRALREDAATLPVPVVMLSARAGEEGVIEGLEAGADDYLIKPFSARELLARVRANLELDRVRRTRDRLERSARIQNEAERLAAVGSWELDLSSGTLRGSAQLPRILRTGADELADLPYDDVLDATVHDADRDQVREAFESALTTGEQFDQEIRLADTDGDEGWVRIRGALQRDEQGRPAALRGFVQDITRQHEAEEAIAAAAAAREAAAREHQIADALQRAMLPTDPLDAVYLELASYYQAGEEGTRVGGDWHDVIDLGAGRTALVIGDVTGRGVRAASLMGQLRAAVRAYARLDLPPAEMLELLDSLVSELGNGRLVTCIYGVHDPSAGEFRYANAGHLPPLLAAAGEPTQRLGDTIGPPLGFGVGELSEQRVAMPHETAVVLYTDGLVERRDLDLDARIDALGAEVSRQDGRITELPDALVRSLAPEGSEDDIAILIARAVDRPGQRSAVLDLPSERSAVKHARSFTSATLGEWAIPELVVQDAVLIASELVTNAILYGEPPVRLRLRTTPSELAIEVDDASGSMPRKLRAAPSDIHGRGLAIIAQLSSRWAARADGHGKTVWSTLHLPKDPSVPDGANDSGRS